MARKLKSVSSFNVAKPLQSFLVPIDSLQEDPKNANKHGIKSIGAIASSLKQFGQQTPIVVRGNIIYKGNGTYRAAKSLGWSHIAALPFEGDEKRARAYSIVDNRSAQFAEIDPVRLQFAIETVQMDFDLTPFEFGLIVPTTPRTPSEVVEDDVPALPEVAKSKLGDVYMLGKHRLVCGDCQDEAVVARAMDGQRADMIFTDPPYGVAYVGGLAHGTPDKRKVKEYAQRRDRDGWRLANDDLTEGQLQQLLDRAFDNAFAVCKEGGVWYVFGPASKQSIAFVRALHRLDVWRHTLVWVKSVFVFGRSDYHYKTESIYYGWKAGAPHHEVADRSQSNVWEFDRPKPSENPGHPTAKPVALVARAIDNSTKEGELIFDPFLGSGSTLIAAEQLGRRCVGIELDPKHIDIVIARWEALTGEKAVKVTSKKASREVSTATA